ncbi:MAG: hypothetical protein DRO99_02255 [Candidatus Aenigmatarchaeota archaeon]|nr:MAG: hypothetical protein DRO99_02255 [Candidatus Aenigmarchaeota archaeon]
MKRLGGLALLLFFAAMVSQAAALSAPTVTFIPEQFSENGSFIALVDPGVYDKSVRVTWITPGISNTSLGLFPRDGDKWTCYFSNSDEAATCGPTPFQSSLTSYTMIVTSVDKHKSQASRSVGVNVGSIKLSPDITVQGGKISMAVYTSGVATGVSYAIYDEDFNLLQDYEDLTKEPFYFKGQATLDRSGTYYFAFAAENANEGTFGGEVKKLVIGSGSGGSGTVSGVIEADNVRFSVLMNKTQTYRRTNYMIKNIGLENLTSMGVSVDPAISDRLSIALAKGTLAPNESMYFTVQLSNMQTAMSVRTVANVTSNGTTVGQIPVAVNVSVLNECDCSGSGNGGTTQCPPTGSDISITPATWSGQYVVGQSATANFTITNNGDAEITDISTSAGSLGNMLSISAPESIPVSMSREMSMSMAPFSAGTYSGTVTITTNEGTQNVLIALTFFEDIANDIGDARTTLSDLYSQVDSSTISSIESELDGAESDFESGYYDTATQKYESASAKIQLLSDMVSGGGVPSGGGTTPGGGSGEGINPIIIILIIALVVLVGVFFYLKKVRGTGGGEEEEFDEELEEGEEF